MSSVGPGAVRRRPSPAWTRSAARSAETRPRCSRSVDGGLADGRRRGRNRDAASRPSWRWSGRPARTPTAWLDARRPRWIAGTPDQARAMVARFAAAGVAADHAPGHAAARPRHDRTGCARAYRPGLTAPRRQRRRSAPTAVSARAVAEPGPADERVERHRAVAPRVDRDAARCRRAARPRPRRGAGARPRSGRDRRAGGHALDRQRCRCPARGRRRCCRGGATRRGSGRGAASRPEQGRGHALFGDCHAPGPARDAALWRGRGPGAPANRRVRPWPGAWAIPIPGDDCVGAGSPASAARRTGTPEGCPPASRSSREPSSVGYFLVDQKMSANSLTAASSSAAAAASMFCLFFEASLRIFQVRSWRSG